VSAAKRSSLPLRLWPQRYTVARLRALPGDALRFSHDGPPVALVVGNGEVSVLAPAETVDSLGELVEKQDPGWRAVSLDAVLPLGTVGVMATVSRVLADVDVPIMVFASHDTDHLLVPEAMLGRALAALHQARLDRLPA
jgi:hypothetical protein